MYVVVSVLFNEPKLLKSVRNNMARSFYLSFSALQRAEIAEIQLSLDVLQKLKSFSALQRAEIAEILQGN